MCSEIYWPIFQKLLTVFHITYWLENWTHKVFTIRPSGLFKITKHFEKKRTKISNTKSYRKYPKVKYLDQYYSTLTLFLIIKDCGIANDADDNTPYLSGKKCWNSFEQFRECVLKLFSVIYWKGIEKKCKQLSFTDKLYRKCA